MANPMEELWGQVSQDDGSGNKRIVYKTQYDLVYLYANGLVDHRKYSIDDWIRSFDDSKQPDGSYSVTHDQWLAKEKYRYSGPVDDPFDPQQLKERDCTEEEFIGVLLHFICPSTWMPESSVPQILDFYRKKKKLVNGKIRIDPEIKKDFQEVLDKIPSPLRILQLDVSNLRHRTGFPVPAATPGTGYIAGDSAQKIAAARLKQLTATKAAPAPAITKGPTVPLKDLRKRKGPSRA